MRKQVAVNLRLFYWKTMKLDYLAETFVPELDLTNSLFTILCQDETQTLQHKTDANKGKGIT